MIESIEVLFQPVSICLLFFCRAGTDLSKCSDLYGISLIFDGFVRKRQLFFGFHRFFMTFFRF